MRYLVGMDEAGYGPNLGPLVISATAWKLDNRYDTDPAELDLYDLLRDVITRQPRPDRLAIADSKQVYNRSAGIAALEAGVLAATRAAGHTARSVRELLAATAGQTDGINGLPSDADFDEPLPVSANHAEIGALSEKLVDGCEALGIRLARIRARVVCPGEFNQLVEQSGNKAAALTQATLELLARLLTECGFDSDDHRHRIGSFLVVCDKHGGRNHYAAALQQHFCDWLIEVRGEGRGESHYEFGPAENRVDVRFRRGGESFLPTALASMTAKYLREIAMRSFNRFWEQQVPGIRPTAGYPVDARRFKKEIANRQRELGLEDHCVWRTR